MNTFVSGLLLFGLSLLLGAIGFPAVAAWIYYWLCIAN